MQTGFALKKCKINRQTFTFIAINHKLCLRLEERTNYYCQQWRKWTAAFKCRTLCCAGEFNDCQYFTWCLWLSETKGKWRVFSGRLNAVVETEPFVMKLQSRAGQRLVAMARVNLEPNVSSFVFFMTVSYFLINALLQT